MGKDSQANFSATSLSPKRNSSWILIFLTLLFAIALVFGFWKFYQSQSEDIYINKSNELKSIATLKVNQITQWHDERISDANIYTSDIFFSGVAQSLYSDPNNLKAREDLLNIFQLFIKHEGYANIFLTNTEGEIILSLKEITAIPPYTIEIIHQAVKENRAVFGDIFTDSATQNIYLDIVSPVVSDDGDIHFVLVLRINPEDQLFPIIQSWPTPSQSAETLIIRKEGDYILFLNHLRHNPDPPLTLKIPITKTDVPAVQAVLGTTGTFEGLDYRDIDVLSEIIPIEGTNWYMISKVDRSEMLAEIQTLGIAPRSGKEKQKDFFY